MTDLLLRIVSVSERDKYGRRTSKNIKCRYLQDADLQKRAQCQKSREAIGLNLLVADPTPSHVYNPPYNSRAHPFSVYYSSELLNSPLVSES